MSLTILEHKVEIMDGSETKYKVFRPWYNTPIPQILKGKKKGLFALILITSIEFLLICSVFSPSNCFSPSSFSSNGLARDVLIHS